MLAPAAPHTKSPIGLHGEALLAGATLGSGDLHRKESVTGAVVRLLRAADRALTRNVAKELASAAEAQRCIAEATALLLTTGVLNDPQPGAGATRRARGGLAPWQMKRVSEFVGANIAKTIRMRDLAALTRLSTSHFCHAFRSSAGEPPHAFVLRRRVERAQELMLLSEAPLSQIALECGLSDQPHLTRVFRRIVGLTPASWRRLHSAGPAREAAAQTQNRRMAA